MILCFRKIILHSKIINKTRMTKIQENSARRLELIISQIVTWNFGKMGLNPEEKYWLSTFKTNSLVKVL